MKVRCWGTRGNLATPRAENLGLGGNTSCYEVQLNPRASLLLDCGTGLIEYADAMMPQALREPHVFHLVVSHFHWDHVLGFPFFHPIHIPHTTVHLYSAFPKAQLERQVRALFDGTYSPLRDIDNLRARLHFHQIDQDGLELEGARIRCFPVHHSEACFAARIEHEGKAIGYVTDHEAVPSTANQEVVDFVRGADLLLHDAQFTASEYRTRVGWGHSSIEAALANAQMADVGKVMLTHHDPTHSDAFLSDYLSQVPLPTGVSASLASEGPAVSVD